jgi:hypothetical protein
MRTAKSFLLVAAVAAIGASLQAKASDPMYPPRTAEQMSSLQRAPASPSDVNLAAVRSNGSPKAAEVAYSLRTVPATGRDVDLAHAARPALPAKDPDYDAAWRQNAISGVYVASVR